jgi:hypothetical protein
MTRRDAARLRPGSIVRYGDTRRMMDHSWRARGEVIKATPNGGLLVLELPWDEGFPPDLKDADWAKVAEYPERWIGYHDVYEVEHKA